MYASSVRPIGNVVVLSIRAVCEHLLEVCDAPQCNRTDANPASLGNAALEPQMGF